MIRRRHWREEGIPDGDRKQADDAFTCPSDEDHVRRRGGAIRTQLLHRPLDLGFADPTQHVP
jgi:hypothetical protein